VALVRRRAAGRILYVVMVKDRTHGLASSGWLWAEYSHGLWVVAGWTRCNLSLFQSKEKP
jgi:hypothetical protein